MHYNLHFSEFELYVLMWSIIVGGGNIDILIFRISITTRTPLFATCTPPFSTYTPPFISKKPLSHLATLLKYHLILI